MSNGRLEPADIEHRRARAGDLPVHYVAAGPTRANAVLLLHGFPETWLGWRALIPLLRETHRVIAPDLRGIGDSGRPPHGYDKVAVASDLDAVIAAERLDAYHLVGADMGGAVAFPLAMRDRKRVRSFTLMASGLAGFGLEQLYDYTTLGIDAWYWTLFQHPVYGPMLTEGHQRELLTTWAYRGSALRRDAIPDVVIDAYLQTYGTSDGWRAALQYYATLEQDARDNTALLEDLGPLPMPTLGIDGEQDGHLSTATLARVASDVRGVLIGDCRHWIAEEQPDRLAEVLLTFLGDVERGDGGR